MFADPRAAALGFIAACIPDAEPQLVPPMDRNVASALRMRAILVETIENLIALVDELDGVDDVDNEPSLAATEAFDQRQAWAVPPAPAVVDGEVWLADAACDRELDPAEGKSR
ncbi:hypothetical protein [Propylenella binzhouense]|uniref:Uncharacterized protein n=1 Tax=Propylenella binzhouense TaxID=2555902 RepID=A0A964T2L8_9HYPH|nr:hypothetical protein [Propylenella binzhouense]MYZ47333.1 hypothetical protein [Propylenella binzhouense]